MPKSPVSSPKTLVEACGIRVNNKLFQSSQRPSSAPSPPLSLWGWVGGGGGPIRSFLRLQLGADLFLPPSFCYEADMAFFVQTPQVLEIS